MFGSQAEARAPDAQISLVNQQTSGAYHTGDLFIQRANGPSETLSFLATATGPYTVSLESAGSTYVPYASWGFLTAGSGAGSGNPRGGGGGYPQIPLGSGPTLSSWSAPPSVDLAQFGDTEGQTDSEVQVAPVVWIIGSVAVCAAQYAMMYATASHICGNLGVASVTSLACGVNMQVTCNAPPPPPQPVSGGGGGGGGGNGGAGGLSFVNFQFTTVTGTVTVEKIQQ